MSEHPLKLHHSDDRPPAPVLPTQGFQYQDEWADYSQPPEGGGLSLGRIWLALRRYWWLWFLSSILGIGGAYAAYRLVELEYTARADILVVTPSNADRDRGPVQAGALMEESSLLDLLKNRRVTEPVVLRERLYLSHQREDALLFADFQLTDTFYPGRFDLAVEGSGETWVLATRDGRPLDRGRVGSPIGADMGFRWRPAAQAFEGLEEVSFTVVPPPDAAIQLGERLDASLNRQGDFISVTLTDRDPERAARILNGVVREFEVVARDLKEQQLEQSVQDTQAQLDSLRRDLREARAALEAHRIETITEPTDRGGIPLAGGTQETRPGIVERYEDLQAQKELLELDRDRIEGVLDDLPGSGVPILVLERIPAVQQSSELMGALEELGTRRDSVRTLLQRYTEEFPDVREQNEYIETLERVYIPSLLGEIVRDLSSDVRSLDDRIGSTARELREVPTRMAIEDSLESVVQQREEMAAEIGRRLEVQKLEFSGSLEDFQVLNPATPPLDPSSDQRLPLAGAVFLGFLGAGLAGAVLLDRFDTRFRYPEDLTHGIGVEVLGMVPRIRGKKTEGEVEEAFRDLRMRLMYAHGTAGPLMVTFASPGPSEGKTLVTANLGLAFAKIGRRTLLIDGDTRRGDLHRLIGGQRSPGLVDFLSGTSDGRIIHRTEYPNLHFMGAGARLARAPELLAGERIQQLFARLRERYDVILVDGPPLAVGADSFHLASIAGSMALVVRAGESEKAIVERKLQALSNLPVRVLGGILNDVASSALKGYGYYSYYVPGYESGSEDEDEVSRLGPGESQDVHIPD